jgi:hypothetical protein
MVFVFVPRIVVIRTAAIMVVVDCAENVVLTRLVKMEFAFVRRIAVIRSVVMMVVAGCVVLVV